MSGELEPGAKIPIERQLMQQYKCSRMTVSKAVSALANAGLIARQRRSGSVVIRPKIHMAALAIPDIREEILQRRLTYSLKLVAVKVIDGRMIARDTMQVGRKDRILALRCLHIADRRVFAVEDRLINLAVVPDAEKADFSQTPPGTWLLQHVPWTEAEHKISAAPAAALAPSLGVGPETACLILERRTWRSGTSITYVKQTFPGSDFDLTARFMSNA